jgi:hypothetical protein
MSIARMMQMDAGAGSGISMNVTYAFDVIDSTAFTPRFRRQWYRC